MKALKEIWYSADELYRNLILFFAGLVLGGFLCGLAA